MESRWRRREPEYDMYGFTTAFSTVRIYHGVRTCDAHTPTILDCEVSVKEQGELDSGKTH